MGGRSASSRPAARRDDRTATRSPTPRATPAPRGCRRSSRRLRSREITTTSATWTDSHPRRSSIFLLSFACVRSPFMFRHFEDSPLEDLRTPWSSVRLFHDRRRYRFSVSRYFFWFLFAVRCRPEGGYFVLILFVRIRITADLCGALCTRPV